METLVANIAAGTRRERLKGRSFTVAPVTMMVEGVLNGNQGPIYYPPGEMAKSVDAWNGMPLLLKHPADASQSGRLPEVLDKQGIGHIFNATVKDGKLTGEAWFDDARVDSADRVILFNLKAGRKMEVSTGLFMDQEAADDNSVFNGTPYKATARNFRPDHLALLLDTAGACSVKDGCGILNQTRRDPMAELNETQKKELVDKIVANHCCWGEEDRTVLNSLADDNLTGFAKEIDDKANREAVHNVAVKGYTDPGGSDHTWNEKTNKWESKMKEPKKEEATVNNETKPALTPEQIESLAFADTVRQERRDESVATITANEANKLTPEQLDAMPLDVLQNVAASQPKKEEPRQSYAGAAGVSNASANAKKPEPLGSTTMDFTPAKA